MQQRKEKVSTKCLLESLAEKLADLRELQSEIRCVSESLALRDDVDFPEPLRQSLDLLNNEYAFFNFSGGVQFVQDLEGELSSCAQLIAA